MHRTNFYGTSMLSQREGVKWGRLRYRFSHSQKGAGSEKHQPANWRTQIWRSSNICLDSKQTCYRIRNLFSNTSMPLSRRLHELVYTRNQAYYDQYSIVHLLTSRPSYRRLWFKCHGPYNRGSEEIQT